MSRSRVRSRGMPSTRSLMTLRAISVVPPPMQRDLAHQEVVADLGHEPVVVGPRRAGAAGELERDRWCVAVAVSPWNSRPRPDA